MSEQAQGSESAPKPNAWRIYTAWDEHIATVYDRDERDAYLLQNKGYTAKSVTIQLKHGW